MKRFNFFSYSKTIRFFLILFFCITLILPVLTGCDDEDSTEADIFEAEQALNDENWSKAIDILESLGESEIVLQYLSNAYAGQVGINTFDLLTTIDQLDDNGDSGSIDMIGTLLGNDDNQLSCDGADMEELFDAINSAITYMTDISTELGLTLNNDQTVQLGLSSLTRTVLIMAKLICEESGKADVQMTKQWIRDNRAGFLPIDDAWDSSYETMLSEDIINLAAAVSALSDGNDIKDDFDQFKTDIDNGQDGGTINDGIISIGELNYYLSEM